MFSVIASKIIDFFSIADNLDWYGFRATLLQLPLAVLWWAC